MAETMTKERVKPLQDMNLDGYKAFIPPSEKVTANTSLAEPGNRGIALNAERRNLPLEEKWNGEIYQIETNDPVEGGPGGVSNKQATELGGSMLFLKGQVDTAVHARHVEGMGRCLMKVLLNIDFATLTSQAQRNQAIARVMAEIRRRCNNNGEIDNSGMPDFRGLMVGDYLDGLDLSGIEAPPGEVSEAPQAWNDIYKNNRLLIGGFNTYRHSGWEAEIIKNHIVFVTRHNVARGRMNPINDNTGGYEATEIRPWLEGATGDGDAPFAAGLKAALGGNEPLLTIRHLFEHAPGTWIWGDATVFLLSPFETHGTPGFADVERGDGLSLHLPIYQDSSVYRVKRWNGVRHTWWLRSPRASLASYFCIVSHLGYSYNSAASEVRGVAPAFCVV